MTEQQHAKAQIIRSEINEIMELESTLKQRVTFNFGHIPLRNAR